ncbi:MAG: MlaD family protein [Bradymonadia bacterium]
MTPFKVGLVVITGFVAFTFMFGKVQEGIGDDPSGYKVSATFKDVSGLVEKSRVVIAGINVGQIDRIELVGRQARVWLLVNTPLKSDATIAKRQASLLGEYYLELTPGKLGEPLKDGAEISNVLYDASTSDLINESKEIVENVKEITASLKRVVSDEGERRLVAIMTEVNETVARINDIVAANARKVDVVFDNVVEVSRNARLFTNEFRRDARVIMTDAKRIVGEVKQIVGENKGDVREGFEGVKGAVSRLNTALDKLDGTLENTESITGKIDDGKGTLGRLVNDDKLITSINDVVDDTGTLIRRFTRLQMVVALRSELYLADNSTKNYFSLKIQPRPDKYYLLQLVDDPRGSTIFRERVTNSTASDTDPVVREQETVTQSAFKFSLQFAKRFHFVTGRIGIMESNGGIGLDMHFFDDKLFISTDLFDLEEAAAPRMRTWASYTFFSHIFIAGGVDEILNPERRGGFIGIGIEFTDDDLQSLLLAAPTPQL